MAKEMLLTTLITLNFNTTTNDIHKIYIIILILPTSLPKSKYHFLCAYSAAMVTTTCKRCSVKESTKRLSRLPVLHAP